MKKSIVILWFAVILICLTACSREEKKESKSSSYSSYSSTSRDSVDMDHSTYCILYMRVSDVKVTHEGSYAYITGSVKNTGMYQIKYVKVKAACKDISGNVIDTDWTYAVDSSWLAPDESKSFEMMVKDENKKIHSADVTIEYD